MRCKNCGNEVKENAKFCRECGSEIIWETEALNGNLCPECGNILEEGAAFCNECGCRVSEVTESFADNSEKCPHCGKQLNPGALFCGECGNSINQPTIHKTNEPVKQNTKKKDKGLVFLVVLLIVVVLGSAGVIGYVYYQNNSVEITTPVLEDDNDTKDSKDTNDSKEENIDIETDETLTESLGEETEEIYLFPSDREYITESDLYGKTQEEVALIRNEIYARHGYVFNTEPFKTYFSEKDWYIPNPSFTDSLFNEIEKTNKNFLVEYETEKGWR